MEAATPTPRRLEIDRLAKRYGEVVALRDMTFDVRAGEVFGFVGSNGAGKTTTMRIALGVLAADAGEVRWDGRPVTLETRRTIGYMPEERGLYVRMKVGAHLVYLGRLHGMSASGATSAMLRWTDRLGVASRRDDEVQRLSLGNQQRVQLAAALLHDPEILVLDEPFAGLDPVAVEIMSGVLRERADAGVPVLFSSHQLDLVERISDRIGIVSTGSMVTCGSVEELRAGASERISVIAPHALDGWADGIPGVRTVAHANGRTLLELASAADDQAILKAALNTGPVHEFARQRPSLTELFRHLVQADADPSKGAPS